MSEQHLKIRFSCSSCGAKYTAAPEQAGKQGNCKKCGNQMIVPELKLSENQDEIPFEHSIPEANIKSSSQHNFYATFALCLAFGWLGLHRFYVKKTGTGVLQLFTLGGLVIWWLTDLVLLLSNNFKNKQEVALTNPNRKVTISIAVFFFLFMAINGSRNNDQDKRSSCNDLVGYYTGNILVGYVNGTASLNISNNCNFVFQQNLPGYGMDTQTGKVIQSGSNFEFKFDGDYNYTVTVYSNKIILSGYNWSAKLIKY